MTKLAPVSVGNARSSSVTASSPPADAPTPTMGNGTPVTAGRSSSPVSTSMLVANCASIDGDDSGLMSEGSGVTDSSESGLVMQSFCTAGSVL
jgi:hypothetical protein